jgi:hypothetical protein
VGADTERDLAAGGEQQHLRLAVRRIGQHIRALREARGRRVPGAIDGRQRLPGQDEGDRLMTKRHDEPPRLDHFVGVRRPQHDESRNRAERRQLLHRLMGRAVFTDANRVVREDVDDRDLHQRTQANGGARIITEDQEPGSVRAQLRERQAVQHRAHRMLPHAEVQVAPGGLCRAEVARAVERQSRLRGWRQIGGAAHEPRHARRDRVEHGAGHIAT